jgi:hypothetical protein
MSLADRLRARGITDPGGFALWAHGAGHHGPLDGILDRDLDTLVQEYRQMVGLPAGVRGLRPTGMDPATAHRMVEEGAQRHRDRQLLERVVEQVVRQAARQARSQHPYCWRCTPRIPCYQHGG